MMRPVSASTDVARAQVSKCMGLTTLIRLLRAAAPHWYGSLVHYRTVPFIPDKPQPHYALELQHLLDKHP